MSSPLTVARRGGVTAIAVAIAASVLLVVGASADAAIVPTVPLATSAEYSVLGGQSVTNTGPSILGQSNGVSPGTSITGFPPGIVLGTTNQTNAAAAQAQSDLTTAYVNAAGRPIDGTTPADLGGQNLQGGVYAGPSHGALQLTGTLTLDGAGNPNSVFVFQTNSSLTTASSSVVSLINGAQECNVFWQIGSSATLDTSSVFVGNILALTSITVNNGVTVHGRALARNGSVTLDNDVFVSPLCDTSGPVTTPTTTPTAPTAVPAGGTGSGTPTGRTTGSGTPTGSGSPGTPGTPNVVAPPRTGGGPLHTESFPWPGMVFAGLLAAGGAGALLMQRRTRRLAPTEH